MRAEALKGHLDTMLLAVIAEEPAHGYRIVERLRRRSGGAFALPEGTVYPALYRLEASGLIGSHWATGDGRRRRVYQLTARGRTALAAGREEWRGFSRAVTATIL